MTDPLSARLLRQHLESWQRAGLTHLPHPAPAPLVTEAVSQTVTASVVPDEVPTRAPASPPAAASLPSIAPASAPVLIDMFSPAAPERQTRLDELARCVAQCTRCEELARTRTQTVFGVGNPQAKLLFLGEAPGADEDAQGEPFVGRAGQLLNRIITAMGLRREDLYICNVLRCRPPGNRNPLPHEAQNCREWLDGQLATIDPEYIVCWGTCAAQNLLNRTETIGKLRKRFFQHGRAKVLCTYHPSYLLRNPPAKKDVWEDMQLMMKEMGLPIPTKPSP